MVVVSPNRESLFAPTKNRKFRSNAKLSFFKKWNRMFSLEMAKK
jgi:hypothetical protein